MIARCQAWSSFLGSNWPGLSDLHGAFMTCVVGLSTNQQPLQSHMVSRIFDASLDHRRRDFKVVAKRGNMVVLNGSKRVQKRRNLDVQQVGWVHVCTEDAGKCSLFTKPTRPVLLNALP